MTKKANAEISQQDNRILSRRLLAGEISEKELQSSLKKLADVADNAEDVSMEENEVK